MVSQSFVNHRIPKDFHSILGLQGVSSILCKNSLTFITPYLAAAHHKVRYNDYGSVLSGNSNRQSPLDDMVLAAASGGRLQSKMAKTFLRHILTQ